MEATSVMFANAARSLGQAARLRDLVVPGFRAPPGLDEVARTRARLAASVSGGTIASAPTPIEAKPRIVVTIITAINGRMFRRARWASTPFLACF